MRVRKGRSPAPLSPLTLPFQMPATQGTPRGDNILLRGHIKQHVAGIHLQTLVKINKMEQSFLSNKKNATPRFTPGPTDVQGVNCLAFPSPPAGKQKIHENFQQITLTINTPLYMAD